MTVLQDGPRFSSEWNVFADQYSSSRCLCGRIGSITAYTWKQRKHDHASGKCADAVASDCNSWKEQRHAKVGGSARESLRDASLVTLTAVLSSSKEKTHGFQCNSRANSTAFVIIQTFDPRVKFPCKA